MGYLYMTASDLLWALGLSIKPASCQGMLVGSLLDYEFLDPLGNPVVLVSSLHFLGLGVIWAGYIAPWQDWAALLTQLILTSLHRVGLASFPSALVTAI